MILKIGHRGAMGHAPENTLMSFRKALELGVDMIELDVHVCKTGELVVIHDDKVDRTTNGKGDVAEKSLTELKELDAGNGEKIPALPEVLDLIDQKAKVNIELKGEGTAKPVFELIEQYAQSKNWSYDDFLVSSFDYDELAEFGELNPKVKIGVLISGNPANFAEFAGKLNAYSVNVESDFINQDFVDEVHKRGLKVFAWIVDNPEDIFKMKLLGVDGIFSNFPDRIKL